MCDDDYEFLGVPEASLQRMQLLRGEFFDAALDPPRLRSGSARMAG